MQKAKFELRYQLMMNNEYHYHVTIDEPAGQQRRPFPGDLCTIGALTAGTVNGSEVFTGSLFTCAFQHNLDERSVYCSGNRTRHYAVAVDPAEFEPRPLRNGA